MLSLKARPLLFEIPKISTRFVSFLEQFCKKDTGNGNNCDNGPTVNVQLENAFKLYNLDEEPCSNISLSKKLAVKLLTEMETIRKMERAAGELYKSKVIRGFCHLYVGQEACCVGIKSLMRAQDTAITSYRSHGWTWLMGVPIYAILAELCQKQTGCSRGKGGSMHTYASNFFGGNGIVGAQTPLGTGVGLFHAYTCNKGVSFVCYGDGAANQGQLYESFNMACLWKLPVIYVCENNRYAMGTPAERATCNIDYYTRGDYIPGIWANGNDVLAVRSATEYVINYALTSGPIILELETYRYFGHYMSDPGTSYRSREEIQMMRAKYDPINLFKQLCFKEKLISEQEFKKIDEDLKNEINDIVKQVQQDKETDLSELTTDVYALNLESNIRNTVNRDLKHSNVGMLLIPPSKLKPTAKAEIKELPQQEKKPTASTNAEAGKKDEKKADNKEGKETGKPEENKPKNLKK